ncbi:CatB-related O-acetyltransferase [Aliiglaciecola litoralis]|uniref:CatB-related O-acetyltransferase n=1 Tax=Aliiglaciecola litoralis TaxID=582857 RepID=A0ABN1LJF5_9ALTE
MATTIKITAEHIAILKKHRIFTGWYPSFEAYLADTNGTGWLRVGSELVFRSKIELEPYSALYGSPYVGGKGTMPSSGLCSMGAQSYSHSALPEKMQVGRYCSIGEGLKVLDSHHPIEFISTSHFTWRPRSAFVDAARTDKGVDSQPEPNFNIHGKKPFPVIGNDVWIGQSVTLSMGVKIGDGAVIAANSVVTKSVPPFAIVGGNPAKVIKFRFTEYQIDQLKQIRWWDYLFTDFQHLDMHNMGDFIRQWREHKSGFTPYTPAPLTLPVAFKSSN